MNIENKEKTIDDTKINEKAVKQEAKKKRNSKANSKTKDIEPKRQEEVVSVENIVNTENLNDILIDLDTILGAKKYGKKSLSFYQNESVANALTQKAKENGKKVSEALNLILESIMDLDNNVCKINVDEKKESKVLNTFKIDERIVDIIKKEAEERNMSTNEYLNKVLAIVLGLK